MRDPEHYVKEIAKTLVDRNGSPIGMEKRPPIYDDQITREGMCLAA